MKRLRGLESIIKWSNLCETEMPEKTSGICLKKKKNFSKLKKNQKTL